MVQALLLNRLSAMGYYINYHATDAPANLPPHDAPTLARWGEVLENGSAQERQAALRQLIAANAQEVLARSLASARPVVVQLAVTGLWECWLNEAGEAARRELEIGIDAMNEGQLALAGHTFSRLMDRYPSWAEAINKLATVFYLQNKPEASIELCRQVVALKPDHFGAWNGLTLCAIQIEDWPLALRAARESLRLQPRSPANRQLLHLVESRFPSA